MPELPSVTLEPLVESVAVARRFVRSNVPGDVDAEDLVLVTSELVSNVVEHASTDVTITVEVLSDAVRVHVRDGSAATQAFRDLVAAPPAPVATSSPRGRGLAMAKLLTTGLGLTDVDDGKVLWFEMPRRPSRQVT